MAITGRFDRAYAASSIAELIGLADRDGQVEVIGIDIPIGLPEAGQRPLAAGRLAVDSAIGCSSPW